MMHLMKRSAVRCMLAIALSTAAATVLADDAGPYAQISIGRTSYDIDCGFFSSCDRGRAGSGKLGGGYQFGVFAIEVWVADWGRASVHDGFRDDVVHLRSLGVNAAWRWRFGSSFEGVLRAGAAAVEQRRSAEQFERLEGTFGLGLSYVVAPKTAIEIAWDITSSTGGSSSIGSVFAQLVTVGLRQRF